MPRSQLNVEAMAEGVFASVKSFLERSLASFVTRLEALEKRAPEKGEKGDAGEKGEQGDPGSPGEKGETGSQGEQGPRGEKGEPGEAGADGEKGEPGAIGPEGPPGRAPTAEEIAEATAGYLILNPPASGRDGERGEKGDQGDKGDPGRDGRDGLPGLNGKDGAPGENGADGRDGKDGLGIEHLKLEYDGERTFTFKWANGERVEQESFVIPSMIYRGVWTEKENGFAEGDAVTWGGSLFVAKRNTGAKPETSDDWQLAVRRGRDGKQGPVGPQGERGLQGPTGKDGRSY